MYALNIDPTNPHSQADPSELRALGVKMVRFTFKDSTESSRPDKEVIRFYRHWCEELVKVGIRSLVILTGETYPHQPNSSAPDDDWDNYIAHFAERAAEIAKVLAVWRPSLQIWNAPDLPAPHPGYDPTLREPIFGRMLSQTYQAIKKVDSGLTVVMAGLVSGQPAWLANVVQSLAGRLPADVVALHPYAKRPDPDWPQAGWGTGYVGDLITAYRQVVDLPFWITEIGIDTLAAEDQAEYLRRFYQTMTAQFPHEVKQVFWFAFSDGMAPGFGLVERSGHPKPAYFAYQQAAHSGEVSLAAQAAVSLNRLHTFAAYLEQSIVFGDRDSNLQRQMEIELIGHTRQLAKSEIQQLTQRMLAGSPHTVSSAEIDALDAFQGERDLFRNLRSVVWVTHQRTGALTGRIGVHTRISAETEANAETNIEAMMQAVSHIQAGNRIIVMDMVKATADENKLYAPDIYETNVYGQHRNGLIENHAWNLQKLVRAIRDRGYQDRVILMLRLDGPDSGANVNPFKADSRRRYGLAIAKFIRYIETVLPDTPFKIVLGNEPDLPQERQWSDPDVDPRTFILNQFAPATGPFMKQTAGQRPDVTFLCPALSANLKHEQLNYYTAFFGEDRPHNLIPSMHGYANDVASLPGAQKNLVEQQAEILRVQGEFRFVSGTEIGSSDALGNIESLSEKGYFDDVAAWLLLSSNHITTPGQDNNWSFRINPEQDDPLAHQLGHVVNRSRARVVRNIRKLDGAGLQIIRDHPIPRPAYGAEYIGHDMPTTMSAGQTNAVRITVRNTSNQTWRAGGSQPFRLGYHWYTPSGVAVDVSLWEDYRTALPQDILSGDSVTLNARLGVPRIAGAFEVRWDMVEEMKTWFAWQGVPTLNVQINVKTGVPEQPSDIEMVVSASHNNMLSGADNLLQAIDGRAGTRWSTRDLQRPGMWFEIDLKKTWLVNRLFLDNGASPHDYPRGYVVQLSGDRIQWQEVARNNQNSQALDVEFSPHPARYIRIEQTGSVNNFWWSIHEAIVWAEPFTLDLGLGIKASHNSALGGADNLLQAIDGQSDTRWSTRDVQRPGMWFEIDLNELRTVSGLFLDNSASPNDYPRGYVVQLSGDRIQWQEVARNNQNNQALDIEFSPRPARYIRIEQTGSASNSWWSIHEVAIKTEDFTPDLSVRASHNNAVSGADNLFQAIDNRADTRWSTRHLQRPGMWFEIDLNELRTVSGLFLDNGASPNDYPRGYIVRISIDRIQWQEVARNEQNNRALDVNFSSRIARYIRIEQTGSVGNFWWSIHQVTVRG